MIYFFFFFTIESTVALCLYFTTNDNNNVGFSYPKMCYSQFISLHFHSRRLHSLIKSQYLVICFLLQPQVPLTSSATFPNFCMQFHCASCICLSRGNSIFSVGSSISVLSLSLHLPLDSLFGADAISPDFHCSRLSSYN